MLFFSSCTSPSSSFTCDSLVREKVGEEGEEEEEVKKEREKVGHGSTLIHKIKVYCLQQLILVVDGIK